MSRSRRIRLRSISRVHAYRNGWPSSWKTRMRGEARSRAGGTESSSKCDNPSAQLVAHAPTAKSSECIIFGWNFKQRAENFSKIQVFFLSFQIAARKTTATKVSRCSAWARPLRMQFRIERRNSEMRRMEKSEVYGSRPRGRPYKSMRGKLITYFESLSLLFFFRSISSSSSLSPEKSHLSLSLSWEPNTPERERMCIWLSRGL